MTRYRMYDYVCECGVKECDVMLDIDTEDPDIRECPVCDEYMVRLFQAPTVLKESFPDGHKRSGFAAEKEANKLRIASFNMPTSERGEINKEISKVRKGGT